MSGGIATGSASGAGLPAFGRSGADGELTFTLRAVPEGARAGDGVECRIREDGRHLA